MTAFLDTNVLVYLFDEANPQKKERAAELLKALGDAGEVLISTQVLQEFHVVSTRRLRVRLPEREALAALREFATFPLVVVTPPMILAAAARSTVDSISFWDAMLVEAALEAKAGVLYTEDLQDGRQFDSLVVRNPFAPDFSVQGR